MVFTDHAMKSNEERSWSKGVFRKVPRNWLVTWSWFCILSKCIAGQENPGSVFEPVPTENGTGPSPTLHPPPAGLLSSLAGGARDHWSLEPPERRHPSWLLIQSNEIVSPMGRTPPDSVQTHQWSQTTPGFRTRRNAKASHRNEVESPNKRRRNLQKEENDGSYGRIVIVDDISYISPSFDRNKDASSSFRHYKDFQKNLKPHDVSNRTISVNSPEANHENTSPIQPFPDLVSSSDFKFPDTIYKDGQVFYRHDIAEGNPDDVPVSPVTPSTGDGSRHYLERPEDSIDSDESQMPRGFNLLMEHVRQVGARVPIISAAIAGASVRGSSKGSTSHVIGSAINGGYFAASAQGYDGKGGAIHSHVHGTAHSVSGGASAIAPDRDGEAFIQVDHSERGLSIGQSSTHNGEAFVIADVDSESEHILQHGDSTSTYKNNYKTKRFGHSLGEAKSSISSLKPSQRTDWNEQNGDTLHTKVNKHDQRSVGIDMIDSIMETVHLPNRGVLPASKNKPNLLREDNLWDRDTSVSQQGVYGGSKNLSEEPARGGEVLTGIDEEYRQESKVASKAQKKGVVGVVTFPYDQEGLPPGPGELLDQTPQIHSPSLASFGKGTELPNHFYGSHNISEDTDLSQNTYDTNRLPLFSSNVQRGGGDYKAYSFGTKRYEPINTNNLKEYRYPQVEERLSLSDLSEKNNGDAKDSQSYFIDSAKRGANEQDSFHNFNIPVYSQSIEKDFPQIYFDHKIHNLNFTDVLDASGQFDDFHYEDTFLSNSEHTTENDTLGENEVHQLPSHTYSNNQNFRSNNQQNNLTPFGSQDVLAPTVKNSFVKNVLNQKDERERNSNGWKLSSAANEQSFLPTYTRHAHNQFEENIGVHQTPPQVTEVKSHGTPNTKTLDRKLVSQHDRNETENTNFHSFPLGVNRTPGAGTSTSFATNHSHLLDDRQVNTDSRIHEIRPGHTLNSDDSFPWDDFVDGDNLSNSSKSDPIPDISEAGKEITDRRTYPVTPDKSSETRFDRNNTEDESPSETNFSLQVPVSSDKDKRTRLIPAGRAGSTQLLEPARPGQPFIHVVTIGRHSPRLPEHRTGIMIGPGERLPGIPGYRIPPGFRAKIIFGAITPSDGNSRRRKQNRNAHLTQPQRNPVSRYFSDNIPQRRTHQFRTQPRNSKPSSRYTRNKDYNHKSRNSNYLSNFCKDLSPNCETMNDYNHKERLCNPFIVGVACCC